MEAKAVPLRNSAQKTITIKVPAADVKTRLSAYYSQVANQARIPGFRPGKAPADVVKKFYMEQAQSDLSERLISEFLWKKISEEKLDVVLPPVLVATDKIIEGRDFQFEVEVDLKPILPPVQIDGIKIQAPAADEVKDETITTKLETLRDSEATFEDVQEKRPAKNKDCVVLAFAGTFKGESKPELCSDSHTLVLGEGQFLPDFEAGVIGMTPGESKTVDVGFPADYHAPEYQGQKVVFKIDLKQIKEKNLPALDDEFAKNSQYKAESLSDLKAKIRSELEDQNKSAQQKQLRDLVGDALVSRHSFDVSPRQVQMFADRLFEQTHHMMHQMGMKHEENEETFKSIRESSLLKAERDVKLSYILEAIAKSQNFEVTDADLEKRYAETAKKTGLSISQVKKYYAQKDEDSNASREDSLKIDILDEKSLDYAISRATIK